MVRISASAIMAMAAALICVPLTQADAAGTPVVVPVGEQYPFTSFQLLGPTDQAVFRVQVVAGTDYYLGGGMGGPTGPEPGGYAEGQAGVTDPSGRTVATCTFPYDVADDGYSGGCELHALRTGTYTITVTPADIPVDVSWPQGGALWVYPDCRGGPATQCTIAPGKAKASTYASLVDDDSYVIKSAKAGRRYVATLDDLPLSFGSLALLDGKGVVIAEDRVREHRPATIKFTLSAKGGPYMLKVLGNPYYRAFTIPYTLKLTPQ